MFTLLLYLKPLWRRRSSNNLHPCSCIEMSKQNLHKNTVPVGTYKKKK